MTNQELEQWTEDQVWRLIRLFKRASLQDIFINLVPPSNSIRDHELRANAPDWWALRSDDKQRRIENAVNELVQLHRLKPKGMEKFSWYTPLSEVEVLDSLSKV